MSLCLSLTDVAIIRRDQHRIVRLKRGKPTQEIVSGVQVAYEFLEQAVQRLQPKVVTEYGNRFWRYFSTSVRSFPTRSVAQLLT